MSEPVRRTGRTCEVRVHEQIRRNTRTRGAGASWIAGDEAGGGRQPTSRWFQGTARGRQARRNATKRPAADRAGQ